MAEEKQEAKPLSRSEREAQIKDKAGLVIVFMALLVMNFSHELASIPTTCLTFQHSLSFKTHTVRVKGALVLGSLSFSFKSRTVRVKGALVPGSHTKPWRPFGRALRYYLAQAIKTLTN